LDHVQRRYEDLFGEADEAIIYFELNPDNDPLKISFCNSNMEGLLGYGPMELKGKDVYSIIGGDQRDKLRSIIRESCTEREMDRELVLVRHDGEGVACRASVNTIRLSSRRMALLVLKE
ncbi:MAG TPA: PAS domain-containing protein, partial [Candidatus Methanofastidiosa archaeon]|nr:PAS domain-containing protein [Candidatus Methanofastidiosa archaeon]